MDKEIRNSDIYNAYKGGADRGALAASYGLSRGTINKIIRSRSASEELFRDLVVETIRHHRAVVMDSVIENNAVLQRALRRDPASVMQDCETV